ncbi:MAG: DUF488 family protein, partial [Planctomycetia bacterium]
MTTQGELHGSDGPGVFTVGHSNHPWDRFAAMATQHALELIVDVRSQPHSRRFPHFSRESLAERLSALEIDYLFLGRELGARRDEPEVYDGPAAKYARIAQTP